MKLPHEQPAVLMNRSIPSSVVIPVLEYPDVREAVDWLCHTFGFVERLRIGNHRAQLCFGEGAVIVVERQVAHGAPSPEVSGSRPLPADGFSQASMQIPGFRISWTSTEVTLSPDGNLAYMFSRNAVTMNGPDGTPATTEGRAVTIWRRESDGEWRCAVDIWNSEK